MQIHQTPGVAFDLPRIAEAFGQRSAEGHIRRASAPLPARIGAGSAVLAHIASARMDGAPTAGQADRVGDGSAPNGV